MAVVDILEGLAVDVRGGQQGRRLRAGDRAGELVAEDRIDRNALLREPLEDLVAAAGAVAIAALGDRVSDEDQLAIAPCHGAVGEKGLGEALADPQLGGLVEMQAVGDLGLEIEVREEVDGGRAGGERLVPCADRVAGGPGGGNPADDGFQVRGVGKVGAQVIDQFLEAGAGDVGLRGAVAFALEVEQAGDFESVAIRGQGRGGGVHRGDEMGIHVPAGRLRPVGIPAAAA